MKTSKINPQDLFNFDGLTMTVMLANSSVDKSFGY